MAASRKDSLSPIALSGENIGGGGTTFYGSGAQYLVKNGDTLSGIASKYRLHSISIAIVNNLKNSNDIHPGQVLVIPPADASLEQMQAAEEQQAAYLKTLLPQGSANYSRSTSNALNGSLINPLAGNYRYISQYFSPYHKGVDFVTPIGTPALSVAAGCVLTTSTGWSGGYGNMVIVDHGSGLASLYAHLSVIDVKKGECLAQGDLVGETGTTGNSTGPHLHFEIRRNSIQVNPLNYVPR